MKSSSSHGRALAFTLAFFFFLLGLAAFATAGPNASVSEIRHWSNPNYTRLVISVDSKTTFTYRLLKKDPSIQVPYRRLYIDIANARLSPALQRSIPINDGLLKMARVGQYDGNTVRVVLDIESIEDFKIFPLGDPFRIVIDVTGEPVAGFAGSGDAVGGPRIPATLRSHSSRVMAPLNSTAASPPVR